MHHLQQQQLLAQQQPISVHQGHHNIHNYQHNPQVQSMNQYGHHGTGVDHSDLIYSQSGQGTLFP